MMQGKKKLFELFESLKDIPQLFDELPIKNNQVILGVTGNSSRCENNFIFVAKSGAQAGSKDGHDFIEDAINNGASVIVIDSNFIPKKTYENILFLKSSDTKKTLAYLCEAFFDFPSRKLKVIGITGTNGKTSSTFMLHSILLSSGFKPKIMGTLGMGSPQSLQTLTHTTMEAEFISQALHDFVKDDVTHVIMEVSSHALCLARVDALNFYATALTNISQDHLDFHGTLQNYTKAKMLLFCKLAPKHSCAVLPSRQTFDQDLGHLRITFFGEESFNDCYYLDAKEQNGHSCFQMFLRGQILAVELPFFGKFHLQNACLSALLANQIGISNEYILLGLKNCHPIPGRFEPVKNQALRRVFIDYAHTPHALFSLLKSASLLEHEKIILVFGCGGDRDQDKRPKMAQIANDFANLVIITDDNPRFENPEKIRGDILVEHKNNHKFIQIPDRKKAIAYAIDHSTKNDLVLIAGKGHENYQIYGHIKHEFSDLAEASTKLDNL